MTLDQLSRNDLLKVLQQIKYYLEIEKTAQNNYDTVESTIKQNNQSLSGIFKMRLIIIAVVAFFTLPILSFSFALNVIVLTDNEFSAPLKFIFPIIGLIVSGIVIAVNIILIKKIKAKQSKDKITIAEKNAGLYPYLKHYNNTITQAQNECNKIYRQYNIHPNLQYLSIINFIINEFNSSSHITLKAAVDDYYREQHYRFMRDEATKQTNVLGEIKKENQEFHHDVVEGINDVKQELQRQTNIQADVAWEYLHR